MKKLAIGLIIFYQNFVSVLLHQVLGVRGFCRFSPSCSNYAINVIERYGILYGSLLAVKRILSCQPFFKKS